ncbi:MAG: tRNA (adenosine(37)-N6)-threonylcarbamoyltransferase complex ATPase subunit type 1 TsaE [Caldilineaceae bacterium]
MSTYQWASASATATYAFGQQLGSLFTPGVVVALQGDLGAGKTVLTQGIAAALNIQERVTSPTFTLVNEYLYGNIPLIHIDTYRLGEDTTAAGLEAATFGLEEILDRGDAIVVIEWAERVAPLLPADHLTITLAAVPAAPTQRTITCTAHGPRSRLILERLL